VLQRRSFLPHRLFSLLENGKASELYRLFGDEKAGQLINILVRDYKEGDIYYVSDGLGVSTRNHLVLFKNIRWISRTRP
jgi:hypothetical protein